MTDYSSIDSDDSYTSDDTTSYFDWMSDYEQLSCDEADKTISTENMPAVGLESVTPNNGKQTDESINVDSITGCSSKTGDDSMITPIVQVPSDDSSVNRCTTKSFKRRLGDSFEDISGHHTQGIKKQPRRNC